MKVLFCLPAYGSEVRVETMLSVAASCMHMTQNIPGLELRMFGIDMAEIARVRNLFASIALEENYDALIMLDSDMGIPPDIFTRLLLSPHEVCGLTYPKREIDLERFHQMASSGADLETCKTGALNFIAADDFVHNGGQISVTDSYLEMQHLPGGAMMIRTSALQKLWKKLPDIRQTKFIFDIEGRQGLTKVIRCFDNIQDGNTKYSEDISFCRRWTGIGGKIYALFDVPVSHFGSMKFEGRYSDHLMARARNVQRLPDRVPSTAG